MANLIIEYEGINKGLCENCGDYGQVEFSNYFQQWECDYCIEVGKDIQAFNRENANE